jgi:hypothetical protein
LDRQNCAGQVPLRSGRRAERRRIGRATIVAREQLSRLTAFPRLKALAAIAAGGWQVSGHVNRLNRRGKNCRVCARPARLLAAFLRASPHG